MLQLQVITDFFNSINVTKAVSMLRCVYVCENLCLGSQVVSCQPLAGLFRIQIRDNAEMEKNFSESAFIEFLELCVTDWVIYGT